MTAVTLIFTGFALCQSVGLAIGIGLTSAPDIVSSLILSIAGGTFVYIACSEIIVHEFAKPDYRWTKMAFFTFGAAIITCLWFLD
jgi:zinc transporter ZupT